MKNIIAIATISLACATSAAPAAARPATTSALDCILTVMRVAKTCPAARPPVMSRVARNRFDAAALSAAGRRELDELIAGLK